MNRPATIVISDWLANCQVGQWTPFEAATALKERLQKEGYDIVPRPIQRCEICDWPLAESQAKGCVPGDCCYRPDMPAEQERIRRRRAAKALALSNGERA